MNNIIDNKSIDFLKTVFRDKDLDMSFSVHECGGLFTRRKTSSVVIYAELPFKPNRIFSVRDSAEFTKAVTTLKPKDDLKYVINSSHSVELSKGVRKVTLVCPVETIELPPKDKRGFEMPDNTILTCKIDSKDLDEAKGFANIFGGTDKDSNGVVFNFENNKLTITTGVIDKMNAQQYSDYSQEICDVDMGRIEKLSLAIHTTNLSLYSGLYVVYVIYENGGYNLMFNRIVDEDNDIKLKYKIGVVEHA